jgi:hypothetical protein
MASIRKDILTAASPAQVWAAIIDIGALHTRLVPGFVTDTRLEPGARIVTFGNGTVLREPIVTTDEAAKRLVWSAEGGQTTHYNSSVQVFGEPGGASRVVWLSDFLPDSAASVIGPAMTDGAEIMKKTLDRLAESELGRKPGIAAKPEDEAFLKMEEPSAFLEALAASGPAAGGSGNGDLYSWLIGSWDLEVSRFLDGSTRQRPGEWHFGWVLEGRAIQDVWIVPPRGPLRTGDAVQQAQSYGTTLRIYDPATGAWRIQWSDPVTQSFFSMIGRREGSDIVQTGEGPGGSLLRWSFREITPSSFLWQGEISKDQGATWLKQVEFAAKRASAPAA